MAIESTPPLIAHVLYRLDVGGLENGLVNLINGIEKHRFRHAIICIDSFTDFRHRIDRDDVEVVAIRKQPGTDLKAQWRIYRTLRRLQPQLVHTRNLAALDALLPAFLAGVKVRVHGEHGWDMVDLHGASRKHQWLRRLHSPLVTRYVALSRDLQNYLIQRVGIRQNRITQIYNGVDVERFSPATDRAALRRELIPSYRDGTILIGTVGRLQPVKNQLQLAAAFAQIVRTTPTLADRLRLVIVGDGELRSPIDELLENEGIRHLCWLPGNRRDIPDLLRCLDVFVQPSLAEGISNTILEAMASGLPVIATDVGGNPELVKHDRTGLIVPPDSESALAGAIMEYVQHEERRGQHGANGRSDAQEKFGIDKMVRDYVELYDSFTR